MQRGALLRRLGAVGVLLVHEAGGRRVLGPPQVDQHCCEWVGLLLLLLLL